MFWASGTGFMKLISPLTWCGVRGSGGGVVVSRMIQVHYIDCAFISILISSALDPRGWEPWFKTRINSLYDYLKYFSVKSEIIAVNIIGINLQVHLCIINQN